MKRSEGIVIAQRFRDALIARGYPVQRIVLFGSVASNKATEESDIDLAVVCDPFAATRHEENMAFRKICWEIDIRIEPICLHPDDFQKSYFALPLEVEREGVAV